MNLRDYIRDIPNFPKPGILFYDITPLLKDFNALNEAVDRLAESISGQDVTRVVGIESRGFIFGAAVALKLGVGFVPIRKPGKLPWKTIREEYSLEYGTDVIEMHSDAIEPGDKVLLVDDLLATGGTMAAAVKLAEFAGAEILNIAFVIELTFLEGRKKLEGHNITALLEI